MIIGDVIVGTLILNSRIIHGTTKSNSQVREFIPYLKSNKTKFLVSTKKTFQTTNIYCIIKYSHDDHKNVPHGTIIDYIGNVDSMECEIKLQSALTTHNWNKKINKVNVNIDDDVYINERVPIDNDIFSIDPIGCEDIDDALHVCEYDTFYEVGIHIADVSSYVKINSELDIEMQKRCSSVYLPIDENLNNKVHNMLPSTMANTICSLKCNKKSRAYSVIVHLNKTTLKIIKYTFVHTIINVNNNYSYDEMNKLCECKNNKNYKNIKLLFNIGERLFINNNTDCANETLNYDSHKMVEMFMLLANKCAGEQMKNLPIKIFRCQKIFEDANLTKSNNGELNDELNEKLKIISSHSAEYVLLNGNNDEHIDTLHAMLDVKNYAHFTSPIRRYIDVLVHRIISGQNVDNITKNIIDNINETTKLYKYAQRTLTNLHKIYNIDDMYDRGHVTYGYIMTATINPYIYIPKFDMFIKINLIPPSLIHLFDIVCYDNHMTIRHKINLEQKYSFNVFQKIEIIMVILMKKIYKMKINVTSPNMKLINSEQNMKLINGESHIENHDYFCL